MSTSAPRVSLAKLRELAALEIEEEAKARAAAIPPPTDRHAKPSADLLDKRIRGFLSKQPGAVSGKGGHNATFFVAGRLTRGYDLSPDEALPYFLSWNEKCDPPWQEGELYRKLTEAAKQPGRRGFMHDRDSKRATGAGGADAPPVRRITNYYREEIDDGDDKKPIKVARSEGEIFEDLTDFTSGWPKRTGSALFSTYPDPDGRERIYLLQDQHCLFSWISSKLSAPGRRGLDWISQSDCASKAEFYAHSKASADNYEAVEEFPHYPPIPGHYYLNARDVQPPGDSPDHGAALAGLLDFFSPATPHDYDLIKCLFLTLVWGGPLGARPIFVLTTPEDDPKAGRGAGKSTLAETAANLVGGFVQLRQNEDFDTFQTRLFSPAALSKRVILIDNVKTTKLSWGDLESLVTSDTISGRMLYVGEGRRPNVMTPILTVNGAALSKDVAQRSIFIHLARPTYRPKWESDLAAYVLANRQAILDDMVRGLMAPTNPTASEFRWGAWQGDVLARMPDPDDIIETIKARQNVADVDQEEAETILEAITDAVSELLTASDNPEEHVVFISSKRMADIVNLATGDKRQVNSASRYLTALGVRGLSKYGMTGSGGRGWLWRGNMSSGNVDLRIDS